MDWATYDAAFRRLGHIATIDVAAEVEEKGRTYPLLRVVTPGRARLLITAGFHGDEVAGSMTLLSHLDVLIDHARRHDVALTVFPCANPSGFDQRTRYNASGARPNNDFLRYQRRIADRDVWVDQLKPGQDHLAWEPFFGGPNETRALARLLAAEPTPHAMLDVHQDPWLARRGCYAYVFGDRAPYLPLSEASHQHLPVAAKAQVDDTVFTDDHGLVELHDGSCTDLFWRRGTPYVATLETTTISPLPLCNRVNLVWLLGFVELAAKGLATRA